MQQQWQKLITEYQITFMVLISRPIFSSLSFMFILSSRLTIEPNVSLNREYFSIKALAFFKSILRGSTKDKH